MSSRSGKEILPLQDDVVMEYGFTCKRCGFHESWSNDYACALAAQRHLFEAHREAELPVEQPEDHGRRFEEWESQL